MPRFPTPRSPGSPTPAPPGRRGARVRRASLLGATVLATGITTGVVGVVAGDGAAAAGTPPTVVTVRTAPTWGRILVLGNGTTVYRLTTDSRDRSTCQGACAAVWPPVVLARGQHTAVAHGVTGLGTITRPGGLRQVTYQGVPLYRFVGDHHPDQVAGNVKDTWGRWWVVNPAHPLTAPAVHAPGTTATTHPSGWSTSGSGGGY